MASNNVFPFIQRLKVVLRERNKMDSAMLESMRGIRFAFQSVLDYDRGLVDEQVQDKIMALLFKNPNIVALDTTGELARLSDEISVDLVAMPREPIPPQDRETMEEVVRQCDLSIKKLIRSIN